MTDDNQKQNDQATAQRSGGCAQASLLGCAVCGGRMTEIRGRHPGDAQRTVCPTCLAERLDLIREMADRDYGRAVCAQPNNDSASSH